MEQFIYSHLLYKSRFIFKNSAINLKRIVLFAFFIVTLISSYSQGLVGKLVGTIKLKDANDVPKDIPDVGNKVLMILYTDPDEKDVNDPLSDAVKAKNFPKVKYSGIGIANCKDTWLPNAAIRMKARQKEQQFPGSVILIDEDLTLQKSWNLATCDDMGVVIIVGKDKKIKYVKYIKSQAESKAVINEVVKIISEEIER